MKPLNLLMGVRAAVADSTLSNKGRSIIVVINRCYFSTLLSFLVFFSFVNVEAAQMKSPVYKEAGMSIVERDRVLAVWLLDLSPFTARYYRRDILRLDDWLQSRGQSVLLPPKSEDLVAFLESVPASVSMKEQSKLVFRSFYRFGVEHGYVASNPARLLRLASPQPTLIERIPTIDQLQAIHVAAAQLSPNPLIQQRNQFICEFAFVVGARRSEIAAVRVDHFQSTPNGIQVRLYGKGGKRRAVLLPPEFAHRLLTWARSHGLESLFPNVHGQPLTSHGVARVFKDAATIAGVPRITAHWFRHAHATFSIESGCPLNVVQATLGHVNIQTTSLYIHARPNTSSALYLTLNPPINETTFLAERKPAHEVSERGPGSRQSRGGAGAEVHQLGQGRRKV